MRIGVFGLWHLGSVTAGCVSTHFETIAVDPSLDVVQGLQRGELPVDEPGLADMIAAGVASRRLEFGTEVTEFGNCDVVWITFDTPVDALDVADTGFVEDKIQRLFPVLKPGCVILVSSQLPIGTCARLAAAASAIRQRNDLHVACSPENLRLGRAVQVFTRSDRIVAGVNDNHARLVLAPLLEHFGRVEWMSVESAEMTKHAINCFLAMSIAYMNEIAALCAFSGADAREVERGLKTESRIGPQSYLSAGPAYGGGTLARDQAFLASLGAGANVVSDVIASVRTSNDRHKDWMLETLRRELGSLSRKRVALLGLTYKPGTNTLRRSGAVELAEQLVAQGAHVAAYDPVIQAASDALPDALVLTSSIREACADADAVVICTRWPEFGALKSSDLGDPRQVLVVDPFRFVPDAIVHRPRTSYQSVGFAATGDHRE